MEVERGWNSRNGCDIFGDRKGGNQNMIRFPFFYFERKKFHKERVEWHKVAVVEE